MKKINLSAIFGTESAKYFKILTVIRNLFPTYFNKLHSDSNWVYINFSFNPLVGSLVFSIVCRV